MLALTVRQPWAWAIIHAGKDIENRTWATDHRGPLLIHAGKRIDPQGFAFIRALGIVVPDDLPLGGIIGQVDLLACTPDPVGSPWAAEGHYHWQLASPRALPYRPTRGQQGLFHVGPRAQQTLGL